MLNSSYSRVGLSLLTLFALSTFAQANPEIRSIRSNGVEVWKIDQKTSVKVRVGQELEILGSGFGDRGTEDGRSQKSLSAVFGKVMFGNVRALERNLPMYEGKVDLIKQHFYETAKQVDGWNADILEWTDSRIVVRVPTVAKDGPLVIQTQQRLSEIRDLRESSSALHVTDPLKERWRDYSIPTAKIARLGATKRSTEIPLEVENEDLSSRIESGEAIFWSYDYNIGRVHDLRGLDWSAIMEGRAVDPTTGRYASPQEAFGAIPIRDGEVPSYGAASIRYSQFPIPMPLKHLVLGSLSGGLVQQTGFVGYVYSESRNPVSGLVGSKIGFSCVSCHGQRIEFEAKPGIKTAKVFPGLPNHEWSMKWNILGNMKGVRGKERIFDGSERTVDKTNIIAAIPRGTGEHTIIRSNLDDSMYDNDFLFSPIAIPIITRHLPVRRALSRPESIAGFEGSYVHSEEPDGAIGAMSSWALKDLTAYMSTLDRDHETLQKLGLYRWLNTNKRTKMIADVNEGEFMQRNLVENYERFPEFAASIRRGKDEYQASCERCHQSNFGTNTDEDMIPLAEVGTYFSPTLFQRQTQSVRTAIMRDLFWVEKRGLLHDGHVRSLSDLVHPDRCDDKSELYNKYYTVHDGSFKIAKGNYEQYLALASHAYFSERKGDPNHMYWDYQKMRTKFGPRELGTQMAVQLPKTPHPWCAKSAGTVEDLVLYLLTL